MVDLSGPKVWRLQLRARPRSAEDPIAHASTSCTRALCSNSGTGGRDRGHFNPFRLKT